MKGCRVLAWLLGLLGPPGSTQVFGAFTENFGDRSISAKFCSGTEIYPSLAASPGPRKASSKYKAPHYLGPSCLSLLAHSKVPGTSFPSEGAARHAAPVPVIYPPACWKPTL